jgi:endonuclease/exonuclease/phosphatase family metal-dependent hydrolase
LPPFFLGENVIPISLGNYRSRQKMRFRSFVRLQILSCAFLGLLGQSGFSQTAVVVNTNLTVRVMAANLSSGNFQRYESPGLNILKGLKPDVVAIQEFNYSSSSNGINTSAALREMIDKTFGTNFFYVRETGKSIPNGVISRFPILASGVWDDPNLSDRDFLWAKLDIPGTNELFVISVHLKASSSDANIRASQANNLKSLAQANFPANAFVIIAGDMNIGSTGEAALTTFKTFLNDSPIPTDSVSGGKAETNAGRSERYDYVFPSFSLNSNRVATVIGSHTFANGLVFDSRVYTPLSEISPVVSTDSGASGMQHMGVVKDFQIPYSITNSVDVPAPVLTLDSSNIIHWQGLSNVAYSIQASTNLPAFETIGTAISTTRNLSFTNPVFFGQRFFRVIYP